MKGRIPEPEYMDDVEEAVAYAEADFAEVNQAFAERLAELSPSGDALRAVDLGTGPGDIPVRVARLKPRWTIFAVDAASAMLNLARRAVREAGFEERVILVKADAKETGLDEASFDVVFSNSIIHHITDTASLWREVKRLGKPGALVFFRDLARPATAEEARAIVEKHAGEQSELLKEEFYRSLLSAYTPEEITTMVSAYATLPGGKFEVDEDTSEALATVHGGCLTYGHIFRDVE